MLTLPQDFNERQLALRRAKKEGKLPEYVKNNPPKPYLLVVPSGLINQ